MRTFAGGTQPRTQGGIDPGFPGRGLARPAGGERSRRVAESLYRAERMEILGRLAGGIAHDFNNLLTAINGYSELLLAQLGAHDPHRREVLEIRKAGERAAGLTRHLLHFSRNQIPHVEVRDLNSIVRDAMPLLRRLLPEDVGVGTDLAADLSPIEADAGQIFQILLNLAVNARDAMPRGGELRIGTAEAHLDSAYAGRRTVVVPGDYVRLEVTDTGQGIPREIQSRVFDSFFTTKAAGEGTGLGLATVYNIVKQHQGYVWVYSEVGLGATFKVYLPGIARAAVVRPKRAPAMGARGSETVLLVEDDDMVRSVSEEILHGRGYQVLPAGDGRSALALAEGWSGSIDLLLTDVVLPGLAAVEVVREIRRRRPEARVLFISGYPRETLARRGILDQHAGFLEKPFSAETLISTVREALTGN